MSDLVDELHKTARLVPRQHYVSIQRQQLAEAADALERWEKATGGLPPELVADALDLSRSYIILGRKGWTDDDVYALRAATFEVAP